MCLRAWRKWDSRSCEQCQGSMESTVVGPAHRTPALGGPDFFGEFPRQDDELWPVTQRINRKTKNSSSIGRRMRQATMPQRVLFEDLVHRSTGSNCENHIEPIADLRILLNANYKIFAEQIPRQLHHERKMLAESQWCAASAQTSADTREGIGTAGTRFGVSSDVEEILMERPFGFPDFRCQRKLYRSKLYYPQRQRSKQDAIGGFRPCPNTACKQASASVGPGRLPAKF